MKKITAKVEGMMCRMCEAHAVQTVRENFDVKKVTASHEDGKVVILCREDISKESLVDAFKNTDYTVVDVTAENYEKKGIFSFLKK